ncbi:MAG: TraB/GumN family protein [Hyphomicrobium sp.]|nr:TraB/GumN family protein [Hyphomicrobium sp.]
MTFFRRLRFSRRSFYALTVFALAFAAGPVAADDLPARCQGTDMLAEMQVKQPTLFDKIMAESKATSNTEAMLWKVEKAGIPASYLFGTMHLSDTRITELPAAAVDAIAHSKSVALEVADLSPEAVAAAMAKAAGLIVYTDGSSLKSALSSDDYNKVERIVVKSGMPGELAAMMKPWLVSMLLATSDCERKQIASGKVVLDLRVAAEAKKAGITVTGLETIEGQLRALASIPDDQQVAILKVELDYLSRADDMMETMVQMYVKRQIGAAMPFQLALAAKSGTSPDAFDGFKKALLIDRNAGMRDAALPLLEKGNAFVAIGALHLPGPTGLVALLRESGYTVTPIE